MNVVMCMYVTIADFIREQKRESMLTQKVLEGLTDDSLNQKVYPNGRSLGRIVWHFTTNIPDQLAHFALKIDVGENEENVPATANEIVESFKHISSSAIKVIEEQWTDESLKEKQTAFGREEINGHILMGLIKHIIHHRGQTTVLIRQAG